MEIGVFAGRTFGLLAAARMEDERLIAVDPFGSDQRRDAFIGNMKRLGVEERFLDIWANRTIKDATVKRYHRDGHTQFETT
jgi:hypothetical protein